MRDCVVRGRDEPVPAFILRQLKFRDHVYGQKLRSVFDSHQRLQASLQATSADAREVRLLRREVDDLQRQLANAKRGDSDGGKGAQELLQRVQLLQQQLTESYQEKAAASEAALKASERLKEEESARTALEKKLSSAQASLVEMGETNFKLQSQYEEAKKNLEFVRAEWESLSKENKELSAKISALEAERDAILKQFIQYKEKEVERMNEIQTLYEQTRRRSISQDTQQRARAAVDADMSDFGSEAYDTSSATVQVPRKRLFTLEGHSAEINSIMFFPSGSGVATASDDKTVRIWDARTGACRSVLSGSTQGVTCVDIATDNSMIAGACNDNHIRLWDVKSGRIRTTLTGHLGKVYTARFSDDMKSCVSGSYDRTMKVWDLTKGYCTRTLFCPSSCNDLCLGFDGQTMISGHLDCKVRVWDIRSGSTVTELDNIHTEPVTSVALSPDGTVLLTNSRDNSLRLIDMRTNDTLMTLTSPSYRNGVNWARACFSPDGAYVSAGSASGEIIVWRTLKAKEDSVLSGHTGIVSAVDWSSTGTQLASCGKDHVALIWE